jgi:hypothetical protein
MNYESDIPIRVAHAAWAGISFSPERRGDIARTEYAETLQNDYDRLSAQCSEELKAQFEEEFSRYRTGYRNRTLKWLCSESRCMSTLITGPSNFPTRRNQKRNDVSHKRLNELSDYRARALAAIEKIIHPEWRPIMSGDDDATARLQEKIAKAEATQEHMRAVNKLIKRKTGPDIEGLKALGLSDYEITERQKPDFCGRVGFADYELTNNNANIRRMKQRLEGITRNQALPDTSVKNDNGITLEDCPAENRIRLTFPGKPSDEIRNRLKKNGFRWTPSLGVWQAYRNYWSMETAKLIAAA